MSSFNTVQFEHDYDYYKMRQFVEDVTRRFNAIGLDSPGTGGGGGGVSVHNDLTGRSEPDTHPISSITGLSAQLTTLQDNINANTALINANTLAIANNIADIAALDVRVTALEALFPLSHASLTDLVAPADDHTQYFNLLGRNPAQIAIFDSVASGTGILQGAITAADRGRIQFNSPIFFDDVTDGNALQANAIRYSPTQTFTGVFVGGGISVSPTIDFSNAVFIWLALEGNPVITSGVNPAFAAFVLFQAIPRLRSVTAGFSPLQSLTLNIGVTIENAGVAIALTTVNNIGVNFSAQTRASGAFATMNVTNNNALQVSPTFSTVALSVVTLGTVRGMLCNNPVVALFQPAAGTETMTAYIGVDYTNITFSPGSTKVALRSALVAATNHRFVQNLSTAISTSLGQWRFDADLVGTTYGLSQDFNVGWGATNFYFFNFIALANQIRFSNPAADRFLIQGAVQSEFNINCDRFSLGAQTGAVGNQVGVFVTPARTATVNGEWVDFLLTQGANITIDATISGLHGWVINPPSITIGTGSLTGFVTGLTVGMASSGLGGADTMALRLLGRHFQQGVAEYPPLSPAALTVDVNDYQPATFASMRQVWRLTTDDLGARNITGISTEQTNDTQWITNVGTVDNIVLQHQNAGSVAANRIISPTGADYTLGQDESALLWKDDTTDRWRILWGTGA